MIQTIQTLFPEMAVFLYPVRDFLEPARLDPARTPLGFPAPANQAGALEYFEVLGNGGHAHVERLRQFRDGSLTRGQARQDRTPCGISQGCESSAEVVSCHSIEPIS